MLLVGGMVLAWEERVVVAQMALGEVVAGGFGSLVCHDIEYRRGGFPLKESGTGSSQAG